jgi:hypothetical protein
MIPDIDIHRSAWLMIRSHKIVVAVTLALLCLLILRNSAHGEGAYQDEDELRLVGAINVYVDDQVTDGCLSQPNALKAEAELILRRSSISPTGALARVSSWPF